jgi:ornithine decarboxylase
VGFEISFLDIGGGFYSPNTPVTFAFPEIAAVIENALAECFGDAGVDIIAEPGRFLTTESLELNLPVIGTKTATDDDGNVVQNVSIPDGIYRVTVSCGFDR